MRLSDVIRWLLNGPGAHFELLDHVKRLTTDSGNARIERNRLEASIRGRTTELEDTATALRAEVTDRQRAAEVLAQERNLLHTLIDTLPDLVYVKNTRGQYILSNKAHVRFLGADSPEQIAGKTVFDIFPRDLAELYHADDQRALKLSEPMIGEIEPTKDLAGNCLWVLTTKVPLKDERGEVIGLVGVARDVTRRHTAEVALRESEMHFRSVAQSACDAIVSSDVSGNIIFWNKAAETIFGYSREEAIGRSTSILIIKSEQLEARRHELLSHSGSGEPLLTNRILKLRGLKKDGTEFPIEVSLASWKTDQGRFYTKTIRDITERTRAEEALLAANETLEQRIAERSAAAEQRAVDLTRSEQAFREQTAILQSVLDSMGDGVVVVDENGSFVMCNPAAEEVLGRTSANMVGQMWSDMYTPCLPDKVTPIAAPDRPLARALRGEAINEAELFLRSPAQPDGIWLTASARPLRDDKGMNRGGVLVFHDVTERKSAEAELSNAKEAAEAASRAKSEFLANMSHEIRTPMTAILGFAERMLAPNQSLSDLQNSVQIVRRNGQHLLNLINDILDISKIEAGQMKTEKIACDLPQILADLRALLRPRALEKGLDFDLLLVGPIPRTVVTDPLRMKQILVNLIGNAIKFTPGGRIGLHVSCDATGPSLRLKFEVTDTGIGMSEKQLARLFKSFTQGDESTTRRFGGTGLGLTISRQLATLLGGDVVVQSRVGIGSTFTAKIDGGPAVNIEMVHGLVESSLPATTDIGACKNMKLKGRILLAEDGRDNQRLLMAILGDAGAEVTLAENGRIAVDLAASQPFDLILMDMQMPELDGYGAATELRNKGFNAPIIALTAHAMMEDRDKCLASGCSGYLTKPIDTESFLYTVRSYLHGSTPQPPEVAEKEAQTMTPSQDRIRSTYAEMTKMKKILNEFITDLPARVGDMQSQLSQQNLDQVKRTAHQLRGAGGGYGFAEMTELATHVEQAVKDEQSLENITSQVDQLVQYMRRIDGYRIDAEQSPINTDPSVSR